MKLAAYPDAAGRAAATAAAYRGMRDAGDPARLEHPGAGSDFDEATIRVTDPHDAVPSPPDAAGDSRQQHRRDHAGEKPAEDVGDRFEDALGLCRRQSHPRKGLSGPIRIGREGDDLPAGFDRTEQRQDRDEHREDEGRRLQPCVPGPDPEPKVQTDHRVRPGDHQGQQLQHAMFGQADEIDPQEIDVVAAVGVEEIVRDAGADDVAGEEDRNGKAQHNLGELGAPQPQAPPLPQRPQRQRVMDEETAIEQRLRRSIRPDSEDVPQHVFHRLERYQADGVVEEMHRHIGEHRQARKKPHSTNHRRRRSRVGSRNLLSPIAEF